VLFLVFGKYFAEIFYENKELYCQLLADNIPWVVTVVVTKLCARFDCLCKKLYSFFKENC